MTQRIVEVKRHSDGSEHRYDCELIALRSNVAIVLLRHWGERSAGGFHFPHGSRTYGFFWPRRAYGLYRMIDADGCVIAHRFDVLEECHVSQSEVSYLDLLLDIWVAPDGSVQVEDEDDVQAWAAVGLLSMAQVRRIVATRDLLLRRHAGIFREATRLLSEAGGSSR